MLVGAFGDEILLGLLFSFQGRVGRIHWWIVTAIIQPILSGIGCKFIWGALLVNAMLRPNGSFNASEYSALLQKNGLDASMIPYAGILQQAELGGVNTANSDLLTGALVLLLSVVLYQSATLRRYHDLGLSKKSMFGHILIPFAGLFIQIYYCGIKAGEGGSNQFGPPSGRDSNVDLSKKSYKTQSTKLSWADRISFGDEPAKQTCVPEFGGALGFLNATSKQAAYSVQAGMPLVQKNLTLQERLEKSRSSGQASRSFGKAKCRS